MINQKLFHILLITNKWQRLSQIFGAKQWRSQVPAFGGGKVRA